MQNLRFSPDGKYVAAGSHDKKVYIWDVVSGKQVKVLSGHTDRVNEVSYSRDGRLIASASMDGSVKLWNAKTGALLATYLNEPHITQSKKGMDRAEVSFVSFSRDGKHLFFGGSNSAIMKAEVNESAGGSILPTERYFWPDSTFFGWVTGGTVTASGSKLAFSMAHMVVLININSGAIHKVIEYDNHFLNDVAIGPDPNTVAAWANDGVVVIWDENSGEEYQRIKVLGPKESDYSGATFSQSGELMATGASGHIAKVWNIAIRNPRVEATLKGHGRIVRICRFSPVENLIATASYDGTVRIWEEKQEDEPAIADEPSPADSENPAASPAEEPEEIKKFVPKTINENDLGKGNSITLKDIHFKQGKAILLTDSYETLDEVVMLMRKYPKMTIELQGHTDYVGSYIQNFQLSDQRAKATMAYLLENGVAQSRITTRAFGGTKPVIRSEDAEQRKVNRRVEMRITNF